MGKRTNKPARSTTANRNCPRLSWKQCRLALKAKLARGRTPPCRQQPPSHRLQEVLREDALECPICLQTLLRPVAAECGHIFCLPCADDLSRHDYACGMCRQIEPAFELRVDQRSQKLVRLFLSGVASQERLNFTQRQKALQEREAQRETGEVAVGDRLDFWNTEEKKWISSSVRDITDDGLLLLSHSKDLKLITLHINSRRLARHRSFTQEEPREEEREELQVADEGTGGDPFQGTRSMYGMPMYINLFGADASPGPFNVDINELLGLIPSFRPFPF